MRRIVCIAAFLLAVFPSISQAACSGSSPTYTAASNSRTDVAACITLAVTGDTVIIPAGSPVSWTSGISVTAGITIQGAGAGRVIATSLDTLALTTGSKSLTISSTVVANSTPPALAATTTIPISNGQTLRIHELGFIDNFLQGTVTSYSAGSLVMNITSAGGTCGATSPGDILNSNCKRWVVTTLASTTITNGSSGALFTLSENTSASINISGIRFAEGSGVYSAIYLGRTTNGKPILIHDNFFESGGANTIIDGNTSRGVIWNNSFDSSPGSASPGQVVRTKDANGDIMPTSWTTISTMGTADAAATAFCPTCAAGENNLYFESNDIHAFVQGFADFDDNSRSVIRYNFLNNSGGASHGADTSFFGLRHFELYNNYGSFQGYGDNTTANMSWWQFIRGGTFAIHDNVYPDIISQDYSDKSDIVAVIENLSRNAGGHACWGEGTISGADYYAPRQVGMGRVTGSGTTTGIQRGCIGTGCSDSTHFSGSTDAHTYVGDAEEAYIWNNRRTTGGSTTALQFGNSTPFPDCTSPDNESNYIISGRDYSNTTGTAKPGYTPYTYPHPLTGNGCGTPDHLAFILQPSSAALGSTLGTVSVGIYDSLNNLCTSATNTITLSKNGSATWGTLVSGSNLAKAASSGVSAWTDLSVTTTAGSGSIDAAAAGLTGATSNSITISPAVTPGAGRGLRRF